MFLRRRHHSSPSMEITSFLAALLLCLPSPSFSSPSPSLGGPRDPSVELLIGGSRLLPWTDQLLRFSPEAPGPAAPSPGSDVELVLAAGRTRRPDVLNRFRVYTGGWNITSKHYWASVAFTGAAGFILAFLWFLSFLVALCVYFFCVKGFGSKKQGSYLSRQACIILLLIFTSAASCGCILLSVGQTEFHAEALDTLSFVVNQSDFTVHILRNVTDFLSLAKTINVAKVYLPSNIQDEIDKLNVEFNDVASTLSEKTDENSKRIRRVFNGMHSALIVVATLMLLLAILGFVLSMLGHICAIYIFVSSGWLLVVVSFVLCGMFLILNNAIGDTCIAMNEWVDHPLAETALSNVLPCVDEHATNMTLHKSKEVVRELVGMVNTALSSVANANSLPQNSTFFYNQSGPLMPLLCSPYDSKLLNRNCEAQEVSFANASEVWRNYTCVVSNSGSCISVGRVTPDIYVQLVAAVNVSYALDYYSPLVLNLHNCNFVRETFNYITTFYCPNLKHELEIVNAGLGLISVGAMFCLILWIFCANCFRKEALLVKLEDVKVVSSSSEVIVAADGNDEISSAQI